MGVNRVFLPQDTLDVWLSDGKVEVEGETMTLEPGQTFQLKTAVRFLSELTGEPDEHELIGKVKDLEQITSLGGEHCADSVILGDLAYEVVEGFVGEPLVQEQEAGQETSQAAPQEVPDQEAAVPESTPAGESQAADDSRASGSSLEDAMSAAVGDTESSSEIDLLARFFLNSTSNK